jgi:hypothetical protein
VQLFDGSDLVLNEIEVADGYGCGEGEINTEELAGSDQGQPVHRLREGIASLLATYGIIDGAHHKQWLIDQIARVALGDEYSHFVTDLNHSLRGVAAWSEGTPP